MAEEKQVQVETYHVWVWLAGDINIIKHACREFCQVGLCVTVEPVGYIYTGGEEVGVRIGLINYPRFPASPDEVWQKAVNLARFVRDKTFQHSVLVEDNRKTLWLTLRS